MARRGYDDTDSIAQVRSLMAAEPELTRHAAIKRVVGPNRSNVRRMEIKMGDQDREAAAAAEAARAEAEARAAAAAARPGRAEARVGGRTAVPEEIRLIGSLTAAFAVALAAWSCAGPMLSEALAGTVRLRLWLASFGGLDPADTAARALLDGARTGPGWGALDPRAVLTAAHAARERVAWVDKAVLLGLGAFSVWWALTIRAAGPEDGTVRYPRLVAGVDRIRSNGLAALAVAAFAVLLVGTPGTATLAVVAAVLALRFGDL